METLDSIENSLPFELSKPIPSHLKGKIDYVNLIMIGLRARRES